MRNGNQKCAQISIMTYHGHPAKEGDGFTDGGEVIEEFTPTILLTEVLKKTLKYT